MATEPSHQDPSIGVKPSGIIAATIACILIGLAIAAWSLNEKQSITDLTPEEATQRMVEEVGELESVAFDARIDIDPVTTAAILTESTEWQEIARGLGISDPNEIILRMNGATELRDQEQAIELSLDAGLKNEDTESVIGMDYVSTDPFVPYLRVRVPESLQELAQTELDGFSIDSFVNEWIRMDIQKIAQQLNLDELLEAEGLSMDQLMQPYSAEQLDSMKALLSENMFLPLTEKIGTENINGIDTIKYAAELDPEKFKSYVVGVYALQKDLYAENGFSDSMIADLDEALAFIEQEVDVAELEDGYAQAKEELNLEITVWLDESSGMPIQMQVAISPEEMALMSISMTLTLRDHNETQNITIPEDYTSIESVLGEFALQAAGTTLDDVVTDFSEELDPETP